jgi:hypothetical protein
MPRSNSHGAYEDFIRERQGALQRYYERQRQSDFERLRQRHEAALDDLIDGLVKRRYYILPGEYVIRKGSTHANP